MSRESNIQANLYAAKKSAVKSPTAATADAAADAKTANKGATYEAESPVSDHRSILGANFDILQTLNSIKFSPNNDGGMYKTTAYIQLWKRNGSNKGTQTNTSTEGATEVTPYPELSTSFSAKDFAGIDPQVLFKTVSTDFTGNGFKLPPALAGISFAPTVLSGNNTFDTSAVQVNLSNVVPTTTSANETPPSTTTTPQKAPINSNELHKKVSGPLKSANAGGGFGGFVKNALGGGQGYGGNLSPTTHKTGIAPEANACSALGVWQFLFNPEEIDWEGGPEYDEAQTWGVMEGGANKGNSGRPLFWKNMKNEKLTFSKVLLNGYVFGKQVDSLEKGLKDLFYREDGDNPTGPPVLEFIWKDRHFGPCVIQDVRVKEKNWDGGILVNAEVSFSLVRIPEWIVNDGYVDVARPSAQPVNGDVFAAPSNPNENRDVKPLPSPPPATKPAPANPAAKLETAAARGDLVKCGYAKTSIVNFQDLIKRLGEISVIWTGPDFDVLFNQYKRTFKNVEGVFSSDFTKYVTTRYTPVEIDKTYKKHPRYTEKFEPMYDELKYACLNAIAALGKVKINLGCPSDKPK